MHAGVHGNSLEFSGGPTPLLDSKGLNEILNSLMNDSVNQLSKVDRIVYSEEALDSQVRHPAWQIGDIGTSYQPEITNFSVDENCVNIKNPGVPVDVNDLHVNEDSYSAVRNSYEHLTGLIWKTLGLEGTPRHEFSDVSTAGNPDVHVETVSGIISHLEPPSCNYSAEILSKYIVHSRTGEKGSWKGWHPLISDLLGRFADTRGRVSIVDGSGLSREDYVTTGFMSELIHSVSGSAASGFLDYLPSPGSGTLRKRFPEQRAVSMKAKTGSLSDVAALSGIFRDTGDTFSVIVNNYIDTERKAADLIDLCVNTFLDDNEVKPDFTRILES